MVEHVAPPLIGVGLVEIGEVCITAPDTSSQRIIRLSLLDKHLAFKTSLKGRNGIDVLPDSYSSIHDWYEGHVIFTPDLVDFGGKVLVPRLRNSKYLIVIHIIDISPHCVNWEVKLLIVLNNIPPFILCNPAKPTLLPSKRPHRGHDWHSSELDVLGDEVVGFATLEEVLLNSTTDGNSGDLCIA